MGEWYHREKMTTGAVALYAVLVVNTVMILSYSPWGIAWRQRGMESELLLLTLTYVSALSVLYFTLVPTLKKWGLVLGITLVYLAALGLMHHYAPEQPTDTPLTSRDA